MWRRRTNSFYKQRHSADALADQRGVLEVMMLDKQFVTPRHIIGFAQQNNMAVFQNLLFGWRGSLSFGS